MKIVKPVLVEKQTYTINEICKILDICKNKAYDLISSNEFKVLKFGGTYRISKESFDNWLNKGV